MLSLAAAIGFLRVAITIEVRGATGTLLSGMKENCIDGVNELSLRPSRRPVALRRGLKKSSAPRALDKGFQGFEFGHLACGLGQGGFINLIAGNVRIRLGIAQASLALHSTLTDIL